ALRERIAAITARPARRTGPPPYPPPRAGEGEIELARGGQRELRPMPANCCEEGTPFGPVVVRREWFPDDGDRGVDALATCLGLAPDDLRRPLFLDTETTGLYGGTGTVALLVGLAWREADGLTLAQYFLRDFDEENALLSVALLLGRYEWVLRRSDELHRRGRSGRARFLELRGCHDDAIRAYRQLWQLRTSGGTGVLGGALGLRLAPQLRRQGRWEEARL